jgi:hypothetical protein
MGASNLLADLPVEAAWVEVAHVRRWRFRWMALIELPLRLVGLLLFLALWLIVSLVLAVAGGGELDETLPMPGLGGLGLWLYWQELHVRLHGVADGVTAEQVHRPIDAAERDGLLASVLLAAAAKGVVVVETVAGGEVGQRWFGALPFFVAPHAEPLEHGLARLATVDVQLRATSDGVELVRTSAARGRVAGGLAWVGHLVVWPLLGVVALLARDRRGSSEGWGRVREAWLDLRGVAPGQRVLVLSRSGGGQVAVAWRRGDRTEHDAHVSARDVLGVSYGPTLDFGARVERALPPPSLLTAHGRVSTGLWVPESMRATLASVLGELLAQTFAEVLTLSPRATRCPYCTSMYLFVEQQRCPSCGAASLDFAPPAG